MPHGHFDRKVKNYMAPVKTLIHEEQTIDQAITMLREKDICEKVLYFYVVDDQHHLKGLVATRDLLLKKPQTKIASITQPKFIALHEDQTIKEAMELMETQRLLALPVLNSDNCLVGVIDVGVYIEESVDVAHTKKRMQIFQMLGMIIEEGRGFSAIRAYKQRMPWIFCTIFGGLSCAAISWAFENVLKEVIILAMFIPLVLALSESISMQSMTQSLSQGVMKLHGMALLKQCRLYILLAVSCSLIVGAISFVWGDGIDPPIIIASGIFISIICSAMIGAVIPFVLHKAKLDPKVAAGPLVLMLVDSLTTTVYFLIAMFVLKL